MAGDVIVRVSGIEIRDLEQVMRVWGLRLTVEVFGESMIRDLEQIMLRFFVYQYTW